MKKVRYLIFQIIAIAILTLLVLNLIGNTAHAEKYAKESIKVPKYETKKELEIVGEDKTKRTLNEKHYILKDGAIMATLYPENVHYEENGKMQEIDNTLISKEDNFFQTEEDTIEEYTNNNESDNKILENKNNSFKVKFAKKANKNNLISIKYKNNNLKWSLKNSNKVEGKIITNNLEKDKSNLLNINNIYSTIIYEDILQGIDIEYNLISQTLKENIILKNSNALNSEIEFEFKSRNIIYGKK